VVDFCMQTILIVDDNLDLCRPMVSLLKHLGYNSQYATGGEAALQFVSTTIPDLVILDVMMPDIDGLEVLRRMKADPRTHDVPVIMFSAVSDSEFCAYTRSMGAVDYWVKAGLDFGKLKERISQVLPAPH
jgi:CheY-like chemotaxis protein